MKRTIHLVKDELGNFNKSLQLFAGFLTATLGLSALSMHLLKSKVAITLVSIGAFVIAFRICRMIITAKKESFGITTPLYSKATITGAKIFKIVAFTVLIPPLFFGFEMVFPPPPSCQIAGNLGLVITQFSEKEHDPFSYNLFDKLESNLLSVDTISLIQSPKFVWTGNPHFPDSLKSMFSSICSNHGLVVYGDRSQESKSFVCNIYINSIPNLNIDKKHVNKNIIYLRNPDFINFSVDSQSNAVAEFILGLLYFNTKDFSRSTEYLNHSLLSYGNSQNKKFSSYCYLYMGNALMMGNRYSEAIEKYKNGISSDSLNEFIHYNLGNAFLSLSELDSAFTQYKTAQRLNDKLPCPISDTNFCTSSTIPQKVAQSIVKFQSTTKSRPEPVTESASHAAKAVDTSKFHIIIGQNGKYGLTSPKGDTLAPCQYDSFCNGEFTYRDRTFFIGKKEGKFGAIGTTGKIEIPFNHPSPQRVMAVIQILIDNDGL